jgi:glycosyltransferase involved in cell wall biosynthesis
MEITTDRIIFILDKVEVRAYKQTSCLYANVGNEIEEFEPDWILVSSEDFGHQLLRTALAIFTSRVIFLARTTQFLPFGPASFWPNDNGSNLIRKVRAVVAVSHFISDYIQKYSGVKTSVVPLPNFGSGPFPSYNSFERGYIVMINPCAVKGISIFLQVARALPQISFAAVPSWGTTDADRAALEVMPNVSLLTPCENVEEIYAKTKILLVPSLWDEAYGKVVIEAMVRGLPVLASNVGGLPEAKLGVEYVLPVQSIKKYSNNLDSRMVPLADIPSQNATPWVEALTALLASQSLYERISSESRKRAYEHVARAKIENFESFLKSLGSSSVRH